MAIVLRYEHNKSLKFVPAFGLHRTRLTPRRLAQTLAKEYAQPRRSHRKAN